MSPPPPPPPPQGGQNDGYNENNLSYTDGRRTDLRANVVYPEYTHPNRHPPTCAHTTHCACRCPESQRRWTSGIPGLVYHDISACLCKTQLNPQKVKWCMRHLMTYTACKWCVLDSTATAAVRVSDDIEPREPQRCQTRWAYM